MEFPNFDIKGKIDELVEKAKSDDSFLNKFKENPIKAVEDALGVDLPDEAVKKIVDGIKAKLFPEDKEGGLSGLIKKITGKDKD
ncbi:MAG: hypothetical protein IK082_08155 [Oscillospiraceae bacterium]|nr:hypothetical protein [Oscillospiraceae bacterium]